MPFPASSSLAQLVEAPVRPGSIEWIGVRPERGAAMRVVAAVELVAGKGVAGDRYGNAGGTRRYWCRASFRSGRARDRRPDVAPQA